jgi:hypothetical protein
MHRQSLSVCRSSLIIHAAIYEKCDAGLALLRLVRRRREPLPPSSRLQDRVSAPPFGVACDSPTHVKRTGTDFRKHNCVSAFHAAASRFELYRTTCIEIKEFCTRHDVHV